MATIITRAGKGSPLTNDEVDANFTSLNATKLEVGAVGTALVFYPTTTAADVSGYFKLVTSTDSVDFNTTAVDVPTGELDGANLLIASLVSDPGVLSGATGAITIHTIGNVRVESSNDQATFYFEVYKRDASGAEVLIGVSGTTQVVTSMTYEQFFADALIDSTTFSATDRVVLKFYGNELGSGTGSFYFQFGGASPVRATFPVPVSAVVGQLSALSDVNSSLSPADGQLLTWDDSNSRWDAEDAPISLPDQTGNDGKYLTTDGSEASWASLNANVYDSEPETVSYVLDEYGYYRAGSGKSIAAGVTITVPSTTLVHVESYYRISKAL